MLKNPQPIEDNIAEALTLETVGEVKHSDCAFYSECLDVALGGEWANFSCQSCTAYQMIDRDQRIHDNLMLRVMLEASEHVDKGSRYVIKNGKRVLVEGSAKRLRGVKPGSESRAKKVVRLPVIKERTEVDLSQVSLASVVLG